MVANKTDVVPYESLSAAARARIEEVAARANAELIPMSNVSGTQRNALQIRGLKLLYFDAILSFMSFDGWPFNAFEFNSTGIVT